MICYLCDEKTQNKNRPRKKPKIKKNWWDDEYYENQTPRDTSSIGGRIYRGRHLIPPNNIENIDLGWARININVEGGKPRIKYIQDEETNVGVRSQTIGMGAK